MAHTTERKHLHDLIDDFEVAMLVTHTREGQLRSRPMAVAEHRDDDKLCFVTDVGANLVGEVGEDHDVAVTMQSMAKFVSINGTARIVRDHDRIKSLWTEKWRPWFPKGPEDADLVLIEVTPREAEYWDQSGPKGIRYYLRLARKAVMGAGTDESEVHGHVEL